MNINCKQCENPLGYLKEDIFNLNTRKSSNIQVKPFKKEISLKCRKCSHYSNIKFDGSSNELDLRKTARELL